MFLGDYLAVERELSRFEFECSSVSTGTPFIARVDEDKRDLFSDRGWIDLHPHACSFLRPAGNGRIICTIHGTNPVQCRSYRCTIMKILSPAGEQLGRVTGTRALHSDDQALREAWEEGLRSVAESAPDAEERLAAVLRAKGYRVL
jgi:Fe-S-cluster containining protein